MSALAELQETFVTREASLAELVSQRSGGEAERIAAKLKGLHGVHELPCDISNSTAEYLRCLLDAAHALRDCNRHPVDPAGDSYVDAMKLDAYCSGIDLGISYIVDALQRL